jgi:hypothetical protein
VAEVAARRLALRRGVSHRPTLLALARGTAIAVFLFMVVSWIARPWTAGDTPFVLDGTNALLGCLSDRDFVSCRMSEQLNYWGLMSPMGDWPLLQYIPDLASVGLGIDEHNDRERILSLLSVAGVAGSVGLAWLVLRRVGQAAWFWGFLLVALSGPIIAYGRSTAGEALATGLLVCLVAATTLRAPPPVVALAALAACLTKETAYPFVAALGVLGLVLARRRTGESIRSHVVWGAAGTAVAIVLASLFNVVRFGSVFNTNYLQPELHTPGIARKLEYALAIFVSPSGGLAFFWPAAVAVLVAACVAPLVLRRVRDRRPALVLLAVTLALAIGFASWFTPFGWGGYGPRLATPWVFPLVLLALVAYGDVVGELAGRFLAPLWRAFLVLAVVVALALPHVGYLWKTSSIGGFFAQTPCDAPYRVGVAEFHACQHKQIWFDRPMPLYAVKGVTTRGGAVTSLLLAAGLASCLFLLRDGFSRANPGGAASRRPDSDREAHLA